MIEYEEKDELIKRKRDETLISENLNRNNNLNYLNRISRMSVTDEDDVGSGNIAESRYYTLSKI